MSDPSATPRVETPEPLSELVAQAIDNLMYCEDQRYNADWLDEVTAAVMSEVDPAIAAAVREERERWVNVVRCLEHAETPKTHHAALAALVAMAAADHAL